MKLLLGSGEQNMVSSRSGGGRGRTVVVGVKLDSESRELLTWALVKVAQSGDTVIALHIFGNNDVVDHEGNSSLLSLVKAFDSVLAVYEGFCNLKQVELKFKICRGSSIRKIIVKEVKAYAATKLILGVAPKKHSTIRSSTSVAKYCAKKLPKDCLVLAVNNGKVLFQREGYPVSSGNEDHHRQNRFLNVIQRSISLKNFKVTNHEAGLDKASQDKDLVVYDSKFKQASMRARSTSLESILKRDCSVCGSITKSPRDSSKRFADESNQSLAIVPVKAKAEARSTVSVMMKQLPEQKPGWPLLRRAIPPENKLPNRCLLRQISVVQWALTLPGRKLSSAIILSNDVKDGFNQEDEKWVKMDCASSAIVPLVTETKMVQRTVDNEKMTCVPKELEGLHEKYSATCRLFKYNELVLATNNFFSENLVGKGGSSQVYKGCLRDGKELAVKILKQSDEALKEFVLEIEIITTLHHKNVISLLGFCFEDNNLLLVYDFLSRGSLEENLHGSKKEPDAFGWSERYKVAVRVAEALNYLHNGSDKPVIHGDVKSSNILLSDDFEPQLSDFGLAKWASTTSSHIVCTDVAGTFGYLAPEYFMYGKVNDKIDVYSFGVVLLELLSGRKPISNNHPKGQESLVLWAKPILHGGKILQLLDPSLSDDYDHDQIELMVLAATLCIRRSSRARPPIRLVLKLLRGDLEATKWARQQVDSAEIELDVLDDDATCPNSANLQSHLKVALLDVDEDSLSTSSAEQCASIEDYLQGRWSRSSSFD